MGDRKPQNLRRNVLNDLKKVIKQAHDNGTYLEKPDEEEIKAKETEKLKRIEELEEVKKALKKQQQGYKEKLKVGSHTLISATAIIDLTAQVTIGDHCLISHRVKIHTHKHPLYMKKEFDADEAEYEITLHPLVIKDNVAIFADSIIMPSVERIHKSCLILSGSVLTKSTTAPYQIWGGNPAKLIGSKKFDGNENRQ